MNGPEIPRRSFLKAGLAAGGVALSSCGHKDDPYQPTRPDVPLGREWHTGEERWVATACGQCPAGCGVQARVVEGRAVKIEGNTACPVNQGGVGPRGLAGPQVLYDPDRIRQPMQRVGERGTRDFRPEDWQPISWDEALERVGGRLGELRAEGRPDRLTIVSGQERGMMLELLQRFATAYGTPNLLNGLSKANGPVVAANLLMQGVREMPAYDWSKTRYVLSLGSEVLQSSCQMVYFARAQAHIRRGTAGARAKIVHVGPVQSRTAHNADEWIALRPGTYGAFVLSLCNVLVREELYDEEFVREHCFGFEPWQDEDGGEHLGFRSVIEEYEPKRVSETCGVRPEVFTKIARDMAATRPCFAIAGSEEFLSPNGLGAAMAVHALNALLGAIDRPGGLLTQRPAPLAEWPEVETDDVADQGLEREPVGGTARSPLFDSLPVDVLPRALLEEGAEPPDTLFLHYSNPLFARARPDLWRQALARVGLIVSFSPFWDETTVETADLVLPDHTYLERWEDAAPAPSVGHPVFGVRQPVVEPLADTRHTGEVVMQLAEAIDEGVRAAVPWKDFRDALLKRVIGIHKAKTGTIVEDKGSGFLKRLWADGYWSDPTYVYESWEEVLRTPTGRFEFFSSAMRSRLEELAAGQNTTIEELLGSLASTEAPDRLCMPRHEGLRWAGDPDEYPLLLLPFRPRTYAEGSGANQPWLQELRDSAGSPVWVTEVELHPQTAADLGLLEGEPARVASECGEVEALVHTTGGVARGLARIAMGGGHTAFGRFAKGWGANVMQLVSLKDMDPLSGISPLIGTRVKIERITS